MLRFVAFVLPRPTASRYAQSVVNAFVRAPTWHTVHCSTRLHVAATVPVERHDLVHLFDPRCGVIIGPLFQRTTLLDESASTSVGDLDHHKTQQVITSAGQSLISQYWGDYVALFHAEARGTIQVLRAPSAQLAWVKKMVRTGP